MVLFTGVQQLLTEAVKIRRDLHKIPEPGFEEYKTSEYICTYLDDIGIHYTRGFAKTGIIATIGANKDKTIAFRADMDALSMSEMTEVQFTSEHPGFMHGCGHDGHMTMLMLFAKYLVEHPEAVTCNIVLIFQPAEEGPGGAEVMIKEGLFEKYHIDEVYGFHLHPDFEENTLAVSAGPIMAMTGEFDFDIIGKSGHGAMPHTANDAIVIASQLINQIQTIVSRNIDPTEAAVVTIGRMEGGERRNIIAEHVRIEGTMRAFSERVFNELILRMQQIISGLESAYDCKIKTAFRTMYPPVVNHQESVDVFIASNDQMTIVPFPPQMIAEDFSYYLKERKGAFIFLGTRNKEKNYVYPLHNARFNFNESVLLTGVQCYINLLK